MVVLTFIYLKIELWCLNIQNLATMTKFPAITSTRLLHWRKTCLSGISQCEGHRILTSKFVFFIISHLQSFQQLLAFSIFPFIISITCTYLFMAGWYLPWPHPRARRLPNETSGHYHTYSKWQAGNYLILKLLFISQII